MPLKPYCPSCGSIKVDLNTKSGICLEPDCKHFGSRKSFTNHSGYVKKPNTKWRDPIPRTMDGYNE